MENNTCVIIKHNVDTTSADSLIADLKQRLRKPIFISSIDEIDDYPMDYPEDFEGWILNIFSPEEERLSFELFFNQNDNNIIIAGGKNMYLDDYCFDNGVDWENIALWIDNINNKDSESYFKERNFLYETIKLFGGDSCVMFNSDELSLISNHMISGMTLEEALYKFENEIITDDMHDFYRSELEESRLNSSGKIQIISPHSLESNNKFYGSENWDFTIVIDDFRDFKKQEMN